MIYKMDKKVKALVLLSGGLDSMLAAKTLMNQNIEVTGLTFISYFFGAAKARQAAKQLGIELKEVDFSDEHLEMVKNPKYGYGKNMNPCIDCHALMLRKAAEYLKKDSEETMGLPRRPSPFKKGEEAPRNDTKGVYDFIATGEILGQRPMSQNKESLAIVAEYSGVGNKLLRPMSAKLLEKTEPEIGEKVTRGKLHTIKGRTREKQIELVKKYGIKEYFSPSGGCLLTDPGFSEKLIKMLDYWPACTGNDVELLKYGRVFWLKTRIATNRNTNSHKFVLIVVGRNKEECEQLEKLMKKGDIMMELEEVKGPVTIVRMKNAECRIKNIAIVEVPEKLKMSELGMDKEMSEEEILETAGLLTGWYATKSRGRQVNIKLHFIN